MYSEIKKCLSVRLKIRLKKETRYCSGFQGNQADRTGTNLIL